MGPVAFEEQLEKVQGYISLGQEEGAELVCGGKRPDAVELRDGSSSSRRSYGSGNRMKVAQEEILPGALRDPRKNQEEVVRQANETLYGLAAGVWTRTSSGPTG